MNKIDFWVCPLDYQQLEFQSESSLICTHCRTEYPVIQSKYGSIPCLLPPPRDQIWVSDPGMYFPEAWQLANDLAKTPGTFKDLVNAYYEYLRPNIAPELFDYYKNITLARQVTPTSDEVCSASVCMDSMNRPFPTPKAIFEIGVGWGFSLASTRNVFPNATYSGVDLCAPILVLAQRLLHENGVKETHLAIADCNNSIPVRSHQFEFVFSESVVEHIMNQQVFMKEVDRILAEHSAFFFSVPARYHLYPECHHNIRFLGFLPWFLRRLVIAKRYNLSPENVEYIFLYSFSEIRHLMEQSFPNDLLKVKGRYVWPAKYPLRVISKLFPKLSQVGWEALIYREFLNESPPQKGKLSFISYPKTLINRVLEKFRIKPI